MFSHSSVIVISQMEQLLREWILELSNTKAEKVDGRMYLFGSYSLGAHLRTSDIDILEVTSSQIGESDIFKGLLDKLKTSPDITELRVNIHTKLSRTFHFWPSSFSPRILRFIEENVDNRLW